MPLGELEDEAVGKILIVGAEASGEIAEVGPGVTGFKKGDPVVMYGALTCGTCPACREGRDNLCENVAGIMGFHVDGFARDRLNLSARLVIPVPKGVSLRDASCAPIGFSTVQHMLFDNAKLKPGETILVQAGGSGIGTVAIKMAKAIGCTVITTVGDDAKAEKAKAELGDSAAQLALAVCHRDGVGVERCGTEALQWAGKAASQGLAEALEELHGGGEHSHQLLQQSGGLGRRLHGIVEQGLGLIAHGNLARLPPL